jgi:predicted RNase H-like nuclease (RuvC/YqgF family)
MKGKNMNTIVRQYKQFRAMEQEIWELRQENAELKSWINEMQEAEVERRKASREGFLATIELVRFLSDTKGDTN